MDATANWKLATASFPASGSPREKFELAVKVATLNPLASRDQPFAFTTAADFVELHALDQPEVTTNDPDGREALIHCGAALQCMKLALKRHRSLGRGNLFPDLAQPKLAARVHLGGCGVRDELEFSLCRALEVGNIPPVRPGLLALSETTQEWLRRGLTSERGWLEFAQSESSRHRLLELIGSPEPLRVKEIRFQSETLIRTPDGVWESGGFTGSTSHERFSRWRRSELTLKMRRASATPEPPRAVSLSVSSFAVLKTKTDDKHGWLAAGQALARVWLQARALGLYGAFFLRELRAPERREELRTTIGHKGFTQAILQFAAPPSPHPRPAFYPATETGNAG